MYFPTHASTRWRHHSLTFSLVKLRKSTFLEPVYPVKIIATPLPHCILHSDLTKLSRRLGLFKYYPFSCTEFRTLCFAYCNRTVFAYRLLYSPANTGSISASTGSIFIPIVHHTGVGQLYTYAIATRFHFAKLISTYPVLFTEFTFVLQKDSDASLTGLYSEIQ